MSAVNNFNLIGYCVEQKVVPTANFGDKYYLVVEVNKITSKGSMSVQMEVQINEKIKDYPYKGKDVAISGVLDAYKSKAGFYNVSLIAGSATILNHQSKAYVEKKEPVVEQEVGDINIKDEDLPF